MNFEKCFVLCSITILSLCLTSCGILFWTKIDCREFENTEDLVWFPGLVGDTVSFVKSDNSVERYVIGHKFIVHTTDYISDTGCSCNDIWGSALGNGSDSIFYWAGSDYIYDQDQTRYDRVLIDIKGIKSGFKNIISKSTSDTIIDNHLFKEVRIFKNTNPTSDEFCTIYIGRGVGIIKMEKANGEVWSNVILTENPNFDYDTFNYHDRSYE